MRNKIKLMMLMEYEKGIQKVFQRYYEKNISISKFIYHFNRVNSIWNFSRVDVKNHGSNLNNVKFLEYDKNMKVYSPNWYVNDEGIGKKIEGACDDLNFMFQCVNSGKLEIILRGMDFRDIDDIRSKIFINYYYLSINGNKIFKENKLIWHNEPYVFEKHCEDNEVILVQIKFERLFDYFPKLKIFINDEITEEEIGSLHKNVTNIISAEKCLLK